MKLLSLFGIFFSIILFTSCAEKETISFEVQQEVLFEGPLFEGPNSGQFSVSEAFNQFLKSNGIERSRITKVVLNSAEATVDTVTEDLNVTDAGLTFAGGELDMIQVAGLNPFPEGEESGRLTVSQEAEITPFFKKDDFILLLDLGFDNDLYDDYRAEVALRFDVTFKKQ